MSSKIEILVFADWPRQMEHHNPLDPMNKGHSGKVRLICKKHGIGFRLAKARKYQGREIFVVVEEKDYHKLGPALIEIMQTRM